MPKARGIGRYYWQLIKLDQDAPFVHKATSQEIEEPFRIGACVIIHFGLPKALVIGKWIPYSFDEETAICQATGARYFPAVRNGVLDEMFRDD